MVSECVRCGYSLKGLPLNHACPECGLKYDERSEVWRRRHDKWVFVHLCGLVVVTYLAVVPGNLAHALFYHSRNLSADTVIAAICLGWWWLAAGRRAWCLYTEVRFAASMPDGLYLRTHTPETEVIPWTEISRAEFEQSTRRVIVFLVDSDRRDIPERVYKNSAGAERLVAGIEARLACGV